MNPRMVPDSHRQRFAIVGEACSKIFDYIEVSDNRQRKRLSLGYRSPGQFETNRDCA